MPGKVPHSGATSKLIRIVLFDLVKKLKMDSCFRCGRKIETIKEFSIDHKVSWLLSDDPLKTFFDMENISFSHRSCNYRSVGPKRTNKSA